jgi:hypothetical protein
MNDEELRSITKDLMEFYGEKLASPEHEPVQFNFQLKTFLSKRKKPEVEITPISPEVPKFVYSSGNTDASLGL